MKKGLALGGLLVALLLPAKAAVIYPLTPGQVINIFSNTTFNTFSTTNLFSTNITANTINSVSNFTQNISVSGKATFTQVIITNNVLFSTNAFPLAAGTAWNLGKNYQFITTNADFVIGSLTGMSNNLVNWGVLIWSNSAAATHFCDLTALSVTPIGPNSTNKVYTGAGTVAVISISSWGIGVMTNLCTQIQRQ